MRTESKPSIGQEKIFCSLVCRRWWCKAEESRLWRICGQWNTWKGQINDQPILVASWTFSAARFSRGSFARARWETYALRRVVRVFDRMSERAEKWLCTWYRNVIARLKGTVSMETNRNIYALERKPFLRLAWATTAKEKEKRSTTCGNELYTERRSRLHIS